ncbi:urea ABC transporter permease subunit UrtC [Pimelobacter simplex]|uniref:urea ABC transporter permease subunit UrtC n=1 Tax=Nocardioides simplex TaxID=2045 RepID=UPI00193241CB|nr:urea ABC transporter permease subunit UrtC [Pimelobacter simplex]
MKQLQTWGRTWGPLLAIALVAVALLMVAPAVLSPFRLNNLGKYVCWAIAGVGIGLAWGRGGMLVMGQGVFFGLGGYAMAMHLKLEAAMASGGPDAVPDFMVLYGDGTMPGWWEPFRSGAFTLAAIVVLPALVAVVLGWAIFKRRVKGAYFAILTQALAVVFATLLVATIKQTGGFNGLNQFTQFFGYNLYDPVNKRMIYSIASVALVVCLVLVWQLYRSRFGELLVATRDAEERVRFLGHDPANIKLVAFVLAAVMASIGGALFAPITGIISPSDVDATASILLIAGVALGGRALLLGPALGALAVGFGRTTLSETFPDQWTYFLGLLFIVVILFLPAGLGSMWSQALGRLRSSRPTPTRASAPTPTDELEVAR